MRIGDFLKTGTPSFSFEFFPPKTDEELLTLEQTVAALRPLAPNFVSVTYGAGGSTRSRTLELASRIKNDTGIEAMAHLTCVGHSREELREILLRLQEAGVENIMALRGDPPAGQEGFQTASDGLSHGTDLIGFIGEQGFDFCVGGAAYPEGHIESGDARDDLAYLAQKVESGACFFITQIFFDNAFYFDFTERARRAGIRAPIIAGIMPITNADQIRRFTQRCGATIPARLSNALDRCQTAREVRELGVSWAVQQCQDLLERGAPGIHFYTLNRSLATRRIMQAIGRVPAGD
ncbi:MAG: methylenetetrahydrofolate reductase [NAD(P)H] [Dehalococcoidia bacterium]